MRELPCDADYEAATLVDENAESKAMRYIRELVDGKPSAPFNGLLPITVDQSYPKDMAQSCIVCMRSLANELRKC